MADDEPLARRTVLETPWFRLVTKAPANAPDDAAYYVVEPPDYVTVLTVTEDGRVLMVRQFRPSVEAATLEFPSGTLEPGETAEEAARREVFEETGHEIVSIAPLGAPWPDTGRLGNRIWCFFARVSNTPSAPVTEIGITTEFWALEQLVADLRGEAQHFRHALHIATLALAALRGHVTL